jgi:CDP-diacylglycerol---serine O-phosphatidyltransferase
MFLKLGPPGREVPLARLIPNVLTTLALCCGLLAIHYTFKGAIEKAMAAVVVAGVLDALDGRAARMLRVTSTFGSVLDSLSDFLAFGVAPAFILHRWLEPGLGRLEGTLELAAVMSYALCAALRLARFTAAAPVAKPGGAVERHFVGMPSPAAAGAALAPPMLAHSETVARLVGDWRPPAWWMPWVVVVYVFVVALLMVSRIPMFSLKALRVGRRAVAPALVGVALGAVGMVRDPWLTLAVISGVYVLSIPLVVAAARRQRHAEARPTAGTG